MQGRVRLDEIGQVVVVADAARAVHDVSIDSIDMKAQ